MQPAGLQKNLASINFAQAQGTALQSPQLANQGVQSLGAEALAQAAQGNLAVPFPSLPGWALEHPGVVRGVPAHGTGGNKMSSKVPTQTSLVFCEDTQGVCTAAELKVKGRKQSKSCIQTCIPDRGLKYSLEPILEYGPIPGRRRARKLMTALQKKK